MRRGEDADEEAGDESSVESYVIWVEWTLTIPVSICAILI
jgi:hypothetical protein